MTSCTTLTLLRPRYLTIEKTDMTSSLNIPIKTFLVKSKSNFFLLFQAITYSYQLGEMIGMGSFGRVFMGLCIDTGKLMAVKHVPILKYKKAHHLGYIDVSI